MQFCQIRLVRRGEVNGYAFGVADADAYNQKAVTALRRAMVASGTDRNIAAFARLMRKEAGVPDEATIRRWLRGATVIPAWGLFAAAGAARIPPSRLLDENVDMDDLAETRAGEEFATRSELQAQVNALRSELEELHRTQAATLRFMATLTEKATGSTS